MKAPLMTRFMAKVVKTDTCWLWQGSLQKGGYGMVWKSVDDGLIAAHRAAYELFKGEIAKGMQIDHLCRNPRCVNPDHLEVVTYRENQLRGLKGMTTHCPKGHPYSEENTYLNKSGHRFCRACNRLAVAEYKRRKKVL